MDSESVHPTDRHVGTRLRLARRLVGMTQQELAERLGITFQQVQKYERAANRISASKLFEASAALERPVGWFFDGLAGAREDEEVADDAHLSRLLGHHDILSLAQLWPNLPTGIRATLLDLMRARTEGADA